MRCAAVVSLLLLAACRREAPTATATPSSTPTGSGATATPTPPSVRPERSEAPEPGEGAERGRRAPSQTPHPTRTPALPPATAGERGTARARTDATVDENQETLYSWEGADGSTHFGPLRSVPPALRRQARPVTTEVGVVGGGESGRGERWNYVPSAPPERPAPRREGASAPAGGTAPAGRPPPEPPREGPGRNE
jgi:hypothetical protein